MVIVEVRFYEVFGYYFFFILYSGELLYIWFVGIDRRMKFKRFLIILRRFCYCFFECVCWMLFLIMNLIFFIFNSYREVELYKKLVINISNLYFFDFVKWRLCME